MAASNDGSKLHAKANNSMFSLIHTMNKGDLTAAAGEIDDADGDMEANLKDPAMVAILDKWWKSCLVILDSDGNGTLERNEYVNLYKRLIYGTSCIYGEKAVLDQHIDDLIEEDWKRDSGGHLSMDKTRLCVSIYELAETWAKGEVVQTYVDFLTGLLHSELQTLTSRAELHEYVFVLYKDELLVQRKRSKKTEVLSKANSTIKPQTPDPVKAAPPPAKPKPKSRRASTKVPSTPEDVGSHPSQSTLTVTVETPPAAPPSQEVDDSVYYSFEARFQLQERIEVCQRQLQTIGHIAEIAWLRCSVREDHIEQCRPQDAPAPYRVTAAEITAIGEQVCIKLQNYLDNAEKGRVDDLTLLVEDVEHGVQTAAAYARRNLSVVRATSFALENTK
ncbi:hypothetical protein H310_01453 [Aphanomyces invadans]|uniref:EF-hand domain-containing protein n=1 Tax=Aphanomyces invadans TaxID=157072 RepID=A0A024USQ6_9STRA|nr:hypothetical protein H310_01453 [Aphanomyces invadans]ETW08975.1 hypothetical protein H310_01453 [Aphanomyces invadans]|eukprot:XP_008862780.1 hypothetical protein H310_01453 [Aphanomyces invadans]